MTSSTDTLVWIPHASQDDVFWRTDGARLMHVQKGAANDWRAFWRNVADSPGAVREMATHATRRAAMDWCIAQATPHRAGTPSMHLIAAKPAATGNRRTAP